VKEVVLLSLQVHQELTITFVLFQDMLYKACKVVS
jgi:hypothetical protein